MKGKLFIRQGCCCIPHGTLHRLVLVCMLFSFAGLSKTAFAQVTSCAAPDQLSADQLTQHSARLQWTSAQTDLQNHCWTVEVGTAGYQCGDAQHIFATVLCWGDAALEVQANELSYTVNGLQSGTLYQFSVVESCDGSAGNSGPCATGLSPIFQTLHQDFGFSVSGIAPVCDPIIDNGSIAIDIADASDCSASVYDLEIRDENDVLLHQTNDLSAGRYSYPVPAGTYQVWLREDGNCPPVSGAQSLSVEVPSVMDTMAPSLQLTDILGNLLADNDPAAQPDHLQTRTLVLPEGACDYQETFYLSAFDLCDGLISQADQITINVNSDHDSQAQLVAGPGSVWALQVQWGMGISTVEIGVSDGTGNEAIIQIERTLSPASLPSWEILGDAQTYFPACTDTLYNPIVLAWSHPCGLVFDVDRLQLDSNVPFTITQIDNTAQSQRVHILLAVAEGVSNVDVSARYWTTTGMLIQSERQIAVNYTTQSNAQFIAFGTSPLELQHCDSLTPWSQTLYLATPCADVMADSLKLTGPVIVDVTTTTIQPNLLRLQIQGNLPAGTHLFDLEYLGLQHTLTAEVRVAPAVSSSPVLSIPSFQLPVCSPADTFIVVIPVPDYCSGPPQLQVQLGQQDIALPLATGASLSVPLFLSAANDGDTLSVHYQFADGTEWSTSATLSVQANADVWAPIIIYPAAGLQTTLDPCAPAEAQFQFSISVYDNCTVVPDIQLVLSADPPLQLSSTGVGEYQLISPPGTYDIIISATDEAGNTRTENMNVQVDQAAAPLTQLACQDTLNVVLNGACQYTLTPEIVLAGELGCLLPTDFVIEIADDIPGNGAILDGNGVFSYTIQASDPNVFAGCWGYVQAFDGSGPLAECPPDTDSLTLADGSRRELIGDDLQQLSLSNLPADVPRCYFLDRLGNVITPANPTQAAQQNALLNLLRPTGFPGDGSSDVQVDNCSTVRICVSEILDDGGDCGPPQLTRTFTATDASGAEDECTQTIRARRLTLTDVVRPPNFFFVACDTDFLSLSNGNPSPEVSGYPSVRTALGSTFIVDVFLNLGATFVDEGRIALCPQSFRFLRRWSVLDWCNPGATLNFTQIIEVGDQTAPVVSCATNTGGYEYRGDTLVVSTGGADCSAAFPLPLPVVSDNCGTASVLSEVVSDTTDSALVLASVPAGQSNRFIAGLPLGQQYIRYTATDECGNAAVVHCPLRIEDRVAPQAICTDYLHLSLGHSVGNRLLASEVNEGSSDYCTEVQLAVRRVLAPTCNENPNLYSDWAEDVVFDCCDLGQEVRVELRVTDAAGNENVCWMDVLVEDKLAPSCQGPTDVVLDCNELPFVFEPTDTTQLQDLFGIAYGTDNCGAITIQELPPLVNLTECGIGQIVRRFRAMDGSGNISTNLCQQRITIEESHAYAIRFPADMRVECGEAAGDTIFVDEYACDLLAISVEDQRVSASDFCFKILRTYRVINWCEYDGVSDAVRIGRDEDCDDQPGDEAVWLIRTPESAFVDRDSLPTNAIPLADAGTPCQEPHPAGYWREIENPEVGFWEYTQILKVTDTVPPIILVSTPNPFCSFDNVTCRAPVNLNFLLIEQCSTEEEIDIQVFYDEFADGTIDADALEDNPLISLFPKFEFEFEAPIGVHEWVLIATDACGNQTQLNVPFEVVDCYIDNPICINGLAATLEELEPGTDADGDGSVDTGAKAVWATDFLASPLSDCSEPLFYSINRVGETPDQNQASLIFTCADIPLQNVEIYVWDNTFNPYAVQLDGTVGGPNYAFCTTYIFVQDDNANDLCPGPETAVISGHIIDSQDEMMDEVEVRISNTNENYTTQTAAGIYVQSDLPMGQTYELEASSAADPLYGVSTLDMLLISKHILGTQSLLSPQALIAADVNRSGHISTFDLIVIRKVILGVEENFPDEVSWRFAPVAYDFSQNSNPLVQDDWTSLTVDYLVENVLNADFIAIKVGDVSGVNHALTSNNLAPSRRKSANPYNISYDFDTKDLSQKQRIGFYFPDEDVPEALQFACQLPETKGAWRVIRSDISPEELHIYGHQLSVSHIRQTHHLPFTDQPFLVLETSVAASDTEEMTLEVSSGLAAEAYFAREVKPIIFSRKSVEGERFSAKIRCFPNPLQHKMNVEFQVEQPQNMQYQLINMNGKLVYSGVHRSEAGNNKLILHRYYFPSVGCYSLRMWSDTFFASEIIQVH